jgi:hypothetical protein
LPVTRRILGVLPRSVRPLGSRKNRSMRTSSPCAPPRAPTLPPEPDSSHTLRPGRFNGHSPGPSTHRRHRSAAGMCLSPLHRRAVAAFTPALDPKVARFGLEVPPSKSRSVLVVSHHLDGFLRCCGCGLVASRCRSWGSSRFGLQMAGDQAGRLETSPPCRTCPSKNSPRQPLRVTAVVASVSFVLHHRLDARCAVASALRESGWEDGVRRLRGVAPSSGLVSRVAVAGDRRPAPSWASFLFKVASKDSRSSISHCLAGIPAVPEGTAATRQLRFAPGGTAEAVYRASTDRRSVRSMKTALEEPVSGTA